MGNHLSKTKEQKEWRKMERLVGDGFVMSPPASPDLKQPSAFQNKPNRIDPASSSQTRLFPTKEGPYASFPKPPTSKPSSSTRRQPSSMFSTKNDTRRKRANKNYNHPALQGQDHVKLVGPGADPSKNKAWIGDVKDLPLWGPGMLPAMAAESEIGKGQQRQREGRERMERES